MPGLNSTDSSTAEPAPLTRLPFPPVTKSHILHCSYDYWHPKYRSSALKARIIPLTPAFLSYLREDGIVLPPETEILPSTPQNDTTAGFSWDEDPSPDPALQFPTIHRQIQTTIAELGGLVAPKLNWSAPKDATWISMKKNSMECANTNDIYLLLKSSDFITHDLEHAFDDCVPDPCIPSSSINYVLVLRKWFKMNPACEFRCFVRERRIIGICQRDLNHFSFLFPLIPTIQNTILEFFEGTLKNTFPDRNFVVDVYLPEPYDKVRLTDINPWAPRTDPLLFSWLELLTLSVPSPLLGILESEPLNVSSDEDTQDEEPEEEVEWKPEVRLVKKDDPEAYSFTSPQYSAHKLPREVVDASLSGESGMREFAQNWKLMMEGEMDLRRGEESSDDESDGVTTTAAEIK
ncbi:hypothetical protein B7494_g2416 [Chlorociboria aeruginascens]|nr:hypothetical protein B7494_g2416 [Chlorociboria aeruginascens]